MNKTLKLKICEALSWASILLALNIFTQTCMLYYYSFIQINTNDFMLVEFVESAVVYFSMASLWFIVVWLSNRTTYNEQTNDVDVDLVANHNTSETPNDE